MPRLRGGARSTVIRSPSRVTTAPASVRRSRAVPERSGKCVEQRLQLAEFDRPLVADLFDGPAKKPQGDFRRQSCIGRSRKFDPFEFLSSHTDQAPAVASLDCASRRRRPASCGARSSAPAARGSALRRASTGISCAQPRPGEPRIAVGRIVGIGHLRSLSQACATSRDFGTSSSGRTSSDAFRRPQPDTPRCDNRDTRAMAASLRSRCHGQAGTARSRPDRRAYERSGRSEHLRLPRPPGQQPIAREARRLLIAGLRLAPAPAQRSVLDAERARELLDGHGLASSPPAAGRDRPSRR